MCHGDTLTARVGAGPLKREPPRRSPSKTRVTEEDMALVIFFSFSLFYLNAKKQDFHIIPMGFIFQDGRKKSKLLYMYIFSLFLRLSHFYIVPFGFIVPDATEKTGVI